MTAGTLEIRFESVTITPLTATARARESRPAPCAAREHRSRRPPGLLEAAHDHDNDAKKSSSDHSTRSIA